ncbi:hypothetical protein [Spirosoma areae]
MAGIRVNTPRGDGWEYSLNQVDWQASRVFTTQPGGAAFVVDTAYLVYCRNIPQNAVAISTIIFGESTNDDTLPNLTKSATLAERRAAFLLMLQAVDSDPVSKAILCAILRSCPVDPDPDPVIPAPTFDMFIHYIEVPDVVVVVDSIDVEVVDSEWTPVVVVDSIDVEVVDSEWEPVIVADSIDVEVVDSEWTPIAPTITDSRLDVTPSLTIAEGGTALAKVIQEYSDGSEQQYTGGGTYGFPIPLAGVGVTTEPNAEGAITVGDDVVNADTELVIRFTFPSEVGGGIIGNTLIILNGPPTLTGYSLPDIDVSEGDSSPEIQVTAHFSDGSSTQYTGAGDYSLTAPYPDDMTLTAGANATAVAHVAEDSITANVPVTYRFTFPDNEFIEGIITAVNVASPPALIIESILREVRNSNIMFYVRTSPETFATGNFTSIYYRSTITDEEGTTGYNAWSELYTLGPNGTDPDAFIFDPSAYDDGYHHLSYGQYYQESGAAFSFSIEFSLSVDGSNAIHLDYEMPAMASNPVDAGTIVYTAPTP